MTSMLILIQELWIEFYEEKVDLQKVMAISSKIFPFRVKLEKVYREKLRVFKYASYRMLHLYSSYLRKILHEEEEAVRVEDYLVLILDRLKNSHEIQHYTSNYEYK